ncbi:hypothetical protein ACFFSY_03470 [Paenibacillus aurantiacus]|uniref:DUF3892 domain-containing protein n=1 Tax=Paenibacillus aurantiacus TaxID=1936118 RepID=A0ABV5KII7_9BACL
MFYNKLRDRGSETNDPFDNLQSHQEADVEQSRNPFGEYFADNEDMEHQEINPEQHFVNPNYVNGYDRDDGTHVEGYWRDGDGDTSVDLQVEDGGGYMQTNPDDDLGNNLNHGRVFDDPFETSSA